MEEQKTEVEIIASEQAKPRYTCAECGLGVIIINGKIIRGCTHEKAAVNAACSATAYGESKLSS